MNILCNPTGKKGQFRAIDWVVEHNNLYTKVSNDLEFEQEINQMIFKAHIWRKIFKPSKTSYPVRVTTHRSV